ncbi:MAG: methyltransferase domain-containing protein [Rudaea sp.]
MFGTTPGSALCRDPPSKLPNAVEAGASRTGLAAISSSIVTTLSPIRRIRDMTGPQHKRAFLCPRSGKPLTATELPEQQSQWLRARPRAAMAVFPFSRQVMLSADGHTAYPIVDGIPVLLAPEVSMADGCDNFSPLDPRYAEAYAEMGHYNSVAAYAHDDIRQSHAYRTLSACRGLSRDEQACFPYPVERWLEATYDVTAQETVFAHLSPVLEKDVLQVGGTGIHAIRFLLAGASTATLVTPMISEARFARRLAQELAVAERLSLAVGIFEELPLPAASMDAVFSGGSLHHTLTDLALFEAARVLKTGGKMGCFDPWRAPFYRIGIRLFGKREPGVFCRPLDNERTRYLRQCFADAKVEKHGSLTRYLLLALQKSGLDFTDDGTAGYNRVVHQVMRWDDSITSLLPPLRKFASSVSICASKTQRSEKGTNNEVEPRETLIQSQS